jgi:V/A-type H+-transporting ATPase subunit I
MIKPVKMQKVSAVILEDKKDAVLRELKERSVIQFLKIEETEESEEFELSPGRTKGINVKAGELLSDVEGMLEVFELAKDEDVPLLKKLTQEPPAPVETTETSPSELFDKVNEKLGVLKDRVFGISSRLEDIKKEREEISNAKEVISKLKPLNIGPADLEGFESTFTATGIIPTEEVQALREKIGEITDLFLLQSVEFNKTSSVAILIALKEFDADIRRTMHIHRFEEFHVSKTFSSLTIEDAENEMDTKLSELQEEEDKLLLEIKELKDAENQNLLVLQEALQIEKKLDEASTFFGNTDSTFLLRGWVPKARTSEVIGIIESASDNQCVTMVEERTHGHQDHPPTLLENSHFAKPMEMLTSTYGTPSYDMVDPSFFMSISFPIIFGMMFGDVGQGLVLVIMGYLLGFHFKMDEGVKRLGRILLYCGLAAMGGGFLYGEVFGLEGIIPALWLHPMHSIMNLITISFYVALVHVSLGCLVKISDELSHGKPLHAIFSPWGIMGLWLFWGGFIFITNTGLEGTLNYIFSLVGIGTATKGEAISALGLPVFFPVAMIAIGGKFVEGLAWSWSLYEAYEAVSRYLFNSLSYVRVAALAIVHAVFAGVMNMGLNGITGAEPHTLSGHIAAVSGAGAFGMALWVMILIGGNIFIIVLETLISFIHTLRLHYYEWFSKFYQGSGTPFEPFKVMRKYTFLAPSPMEDKQ